MQLPKIFSFKSKKTTHQDLAKNMLKHETKQHVLFKFSAVLLVFLGYFAFIAHQYGLQSGFFVTSLTWSFFVLCTPIADAGFLLDFPFRFITKIRMLYSELVVWGIAIFLNLFAFFKHPEIYSKTKLLMLFQHILEQPFPFWSIILISGIGTFMSIQFGDELMDTVKHSERSKYHSQKHSHRFIAMFFVFLLAVILYDFLLKQLGVDIPL